MQAPLRVLVDDLDLGVCQTKVLTDTLVSGSKVPIEVVTASSLRPGSNNTWQVKSVVARRLAAKLVALISKEPQATLYLGGNCILRGDVGELFDCVDDGVLLSGPERTLVRTTCFLIRPNGSRMAAIAKEARRLLRGAYDTAAAFQLPAALLPEDWLPVSYLANPNAHIIDCTSLVNRPWYSSTAPGCEIWLRQLYLAIERGALTKADLDSDVVGRRIRPSLPYQVASAGSCAERISATLQDLDCSFVPPEMALSDEQLRTIRTTKFKLPRRRMTRRALALAAKRRLHKSKQTLVSVRRRATLVKRLPAAAMRRSRRAAIIVFTSLQSLRPKA